MEGRGAVIEIHDYLPSTVKARYLPWRPINIMALGDIQLGSEGCDVDRLKRHIAWGLRNDCHFIGMGDYTDFLSPSNRQRLRGATLYDTAQHLIDEWHLTHMHALRDLLEPTRGRWIGMHEGHHYHEFSEGGTSDTWLAGEMDAPFLGTAAVTRLQFRDDAAHRSVAAHVWSHHGEGSGATAASPFNKLEKVSGAIDADVFFMGHYHRAGVIFTDRLFVGGVRAPRLRHRSRALVATGSFLRSYLQGSRNGGRAQGGYVEKAMMNPATLGNGMVTVTPVHREDWDTIELSCTIMSI